MIDCLAGLERRAAVDAQRDDVLCVAACDAASGPHLILIGLLIAGPCGALLTGRWAPTAASGCLALAPSG